MDSDMQLEQPVNPPNNWGIDPRKRTLKDFTFVILFAVVSVIVALIALLPSTVGLQLSTTSDIPLFAILFVTVYAFFKSLEDPGKVFHDADVLARNESKRWQENVLIPFLEEKYNFKFSPTHDFAYSFDFPRVIKNGKTMEVRIHGVEANRTSFDPSFDFGSEGFLNFDLEDDVWVEEVIRPESVTYRKLEEAHH